MSQIAEVFAGCREAGRAAFIPFLMAGDPDLATTEKLVHAMAAGGADLIELGVPFSDPIADGPTNQRAAGRALAAGTTLSGVLDLIARCRAELTTPIVLFTYFNPIFRRGVQVFAEQAAASGVDGVLCVDLPPEEAGDLAPALIEQGIDPVFLLAPTSNKVRQRGASKAARGFVYYVSRTGVTGSETGLSPSLIKEVKAVRKQVDLPLAVGFGITRPEEVETIGTVADGVVVGSELVRLVEEHGDSEELPAMLRLKVAELCAPLHKPRRSFLPWRRKRSEG